MAQHPHPPHEPPKREQDPAHEHERDADQQRRQGEGGDVPGGSPPREEPKHSPSQTPAEQEHHDNPKSVATPPEEDLAGPQREWMLKHTPPKERDEHEKQQVDQAKQLQQRWKDDEQHLADDDHSHQGASAPEPKSARDHYPGQFEQPTRWDAPRQYGDHAG